MKFLGKASQNRNYYLALDMDSGNGLTPFDDDNLWTLFSFDSNLLMDENIDNLDGLQNYLENNKDITFNKPLENFKKTCIKNGFSENKFFDKLESLLNEKGIVLRPINAFRHDDIILSACVSNPFDEYGFDNSVVGVAIVSKNKLRKEYNKKRVSKKLLKIAKNELDTELSLINDYYNGNMYGIVVKDDNENTVDSCYGIYETDIDNAKNELKFAESII